MVVKVILDFLAVHLMQMGEWWELFFDRKREGGEGRFFSEKRGRKLSI